MQLHYLYVPHGGPVPGADRLICGARICGHIIQHLRQCASPHDLPKIDLVLQPKRTFANGDARALRHIRHVPTEDHLPTLLEIQPPGEQAPLTGLRQSPTYLSVDRYISFPHALAMEPPVPTPSRPNATGAGPGNPTHAPRQYPARPKRATLLCRCASCVSPHSSPAAPSSSVPRAIPRFQKRAPPPK